MNRAVDGIPSVPSRQTSDYRALLVGGAPLLDVRAPIEFVRGAFPTSLNQPLMTDEERHLIGIRYKAEGQDRAIELGAELIDGEQRQQRTHGWHEFATANPGGALYCFRGGLRSRIAQAWLRESGIDYPLVTGGYKALRSYLIESLERLCASQPLVVIGGRTGCGKTQLIKQLERHVDLEALARHRGSSFGRLASEQPSNIDFENAVCIELLRLNEACVEPVYLEDEARLIGRICMPATLVDTMREAPLMILEAPLEERVELCLQDYVVDLLQRHRDPAESDEGGFRQFAEAHRNSLDRVRKRLGGDHHRQASRLLEEAFTDHKRSNSLDGYRPFIELMLTHYYDPMYDFQLRNKLHRVIARGTQGELLNQLATP